MKIRLLLATFGFIALLAACAPAPELRSDEYLPDDSIITGDPCGPPCWRGITPGETNWDDALIIVEDDPTLTDIEESTAEDEDSDAIGAVFGPVDGQRCCQMVAEDGETVSFVVLQTTPDVTLGQVIEEHGEPDYLTGEVLTGDQGVMSLFFIDLQTLLYVFIEGEEGELTASSEVIAFGYTTEDDMQTLIELEELHAWEGYQSFTDYMEGELEVTPSITATPEGDG